jgi:hypothetical protein
MIWEQTFMYCRKRGGAALSHRRAIAPHKVFTHGREWERSRAVAIIVHEDLETKGEIKRDDGY